MKIPFSNLKPLFESRKEEYINAFAERLESCDFIGGSDIRLFESEFADVFGVSNPCSCANGTDALYIALRALGVGPGDHVLTPVHSWISSAETITQCGAELEFVDSSTEGFCLSVEDVKKKLRRNTKAIIAVHLFGEPIDLTEIRCLCDSHGIYLIEDCSQAHGAISGVQPVGSTGDFATFSLFPTKNLGALGDAGIASAKNPELIDKFRLFANHGGKGIHKFEGVNSRLDSIQACFLRLKLKYFKADHEKRLQIADMYNQSFLDIEDINIPRLSASKGKHAYHIYTIKIDGSKRDKVMSYLLDCQIEARLMYPKLLHKLPAYELAHSQKHYPNAMKNHLSMISLPLYSGMQQEEVTYIIDSVLRAVGHSR